MINWGIIGCGDVTELKSGPAFNKVKGSFLVAVMRRNAGKARDYAARHNVPKWYIDANELIHDPDINAIYVATPPDSHEQYTIAALRAGKPVYVEKPMALDLAASKRMLQVSVEENVKLSVAHYRREQPMFKKIKELLHDKVIGDIKFVDLKFLKVALSNADLQIPKTKWRVNPAIAGGGLFHDLAPHQLDLMLYFFGEIKKKSGVSFNQYKNYPADDIVAGHILFENGIVFNGLWCFTVGEKEALDQVEIIGSEGRISFSVFDKYSFSVSQDGMSQEFTYEKIQHVQQPMIEKVVQYFLDQAPNPCPPEAGVRVMEIMEAFTRTAH
jgi:predicted dehydrogenase